MMIPARGVPVEPPATERASEGGRVMVPAARALETVVTPDGDPVMRAKFLVPVLNTAVLERQRLLDLVTKATTGPLTLISAPAGSGKTVLASSWVRSGAAPWPVAW